MKQFLYDLTLAVSAGTILLIVAPFACLLTDKAVDKLTKKVEELN